MLGLCGAYVGPELVYLWLLRGHVGLCWAYVGWFVALMGSKINPNGTSVPLGLVLGLCWAHVGPFEVYVRNTLCHLVSKLGQCWAIWGRCWGHVGAMLGLCRGPDRLFWNHVGPAGPKWRDSTYFEVQTQFYLGLIRYQNLEGPWSKKTWGCWRWCYHSGSTIYYYSNNKLGVCLLVSQSTY